MEFLWTNEQEELRRVLRRFLEARAPERWVRQTMATSEGLDRLLWKQMADELGLQGLMIPERYGGSGSSAKDVAVVMEELGRAVTCGPFLSTAVLSVAALLSSGDEDACGRLLPRIADGELVVTVAHEPERPIGAARSAQVWAEPDAEGYRLSGRCGYVLDGQVADVILVVADTPSGIGSFEVSTADPAVRREPLATMDQTRKQARVELSDAPGQAVGMPGAADRVVASALDCAVIALASEQVGGAQRCLDMAVEYAKDRVQFNRPIGSFQAIKHKCAAVATEIELARSAAIFAASRLTEGADDVAVAASVAKAVCSEAFVKAAKESIQVHGGIGYTWEHPAHLYLKRAKADAALFGGVPSHRRRVADLIGL